MPVATVASDFASEGPAKSKLQKGHDPAKSKLQKGHALASSKGNYQAKSMKLMGG